MAFVGHKVYCPKCKGTYPIIEGMPTTTVYGKGVALEGMKTACGAALIATQFVTTVGASGGRSGGQSRSVNRVANPAVYRGDEEKAHQSDYDLFFQIKHEKTDLNLRDIPYKITLNDGQEFEGTTDENGYTQKVFADSSQIAKIEVPYHGNSSCTTNTNIESDTCGC
jgi:PAAR motif